MQFTFRTLVVVFVLLFSTKLWAKGYDTCSAAFKYYEDDNHSHKAFATFNGTTPGSSSDVVCGGASSDDLARAVHSALTECQRRAKKYHHSGKCQIYRKQ